MLLYVHSNSMLGSSTSLCSYKQVTGSKSVSMDTEKVGIVSGDMISSLPDHVLCHILSFLSTKHAASTSVLSSRWRDLFAFVPNLYFDDFMHHQKERRDSDGILRCFMNFVDRVLSLRGGLPIKKFSLKCRNGVDPARINNWIHDVLECGVLDLYIHISPGGEYSLPSEVFTSKTLVKLKLETGPSLSRLPPDVCFPMLKTLYLGWVGFEDDGIAINRLLSSCTVLEELVISVPGWETWNGFCSISSVTLKRLTIDNWGFSSCRQGEFSFDTPNLVYLEYSDHAADEYPTMNLDALVEVRLNLLMIEENFLCVKVINNRWLEDDEHDRIPRPFGDTTDLIKGISNVQILSLSAEALKVLSLFCEAMPVFDNLIHLSIENESYIGWKLLPVLLKNSPNLETLVLKGLLHSITDRCGDACSCIPRRNISCCLSSCPLKTLEIWWFEGAPRELKLVKHFLEKLPCLEEMIICAVGADYMSKVSKDLMMFPRASSKCRIRII